uniref:PX domain-containing protein n=1 Tax=Salmo trutta TaxID=8032 RepID=A0A673WG65_SALTR
TRSPGVRCFLRHIGAAGFLVKRALCQKAFVSKRGPEGVKGVLVWRRYSELKKNLFRRQEKFPPFPRAHLFGRFDEGVIEERRSAACYCSPPTSLLSTTALS